MIAMLGNTPASEVMCACGHSEMHVKSPRDAINEIFIKNAARRICKACLAVHEAKRKSMISNSVQRAKQAVIRSKLTGSEKQIKWAVDIREKWLLHIVKRDIPYSLKPISETAKSNGAFPDAVEQATTSVLVARLAAIDEVLAHTESTWWINSWKHGLLDWIVNSRTDEAIKSELAVLLLLSEFAHSDFPSTRFWAFGARTL
jgi:hypothetical protein